VYFLRHFPSRPAFAKRAHAFCAACCRLVFGLSSQHFASVEPVPISKLSGDLAAKEQFNTFKVLGDHLPSSRKLS
jgi:hypothetical protein